MAAPAAAASPDWHFFFTAPTSAQEKGIKGIFRHYGDIEFAPVVLGSRHWRLALTPGVQGKKLEDLHRCLTPQWTIDPTTLIGSKLKELGIDCGKVLFEQPKSFVPISSEYLRRLIDMEEKYNKLAIRYVELEQINEGLRVQLQKRAA